MSVSRHDETDGGAGCLMLTDLPKELNLLHEAGWGNEFGYKMRIEMYDMFRQNVGHGSKYVYNMYI